MRRALALALLAVRRGVPGARLDTDGECHFLDGNEEVASDVDRQRLERGDVEGVETFSLASRQPTCLSLSKAFAFYVWQRGRREGFDRLSQAGFG